MLRMPVGQRDWHDVWRRQVRWGSTRLKLSPEVRALVLLEPAIGWLAYGERLSLGDGAGAILICVALVLIRLPSSRVETNRAEAH